MLTKLIDAYLGVSVTLILVAWCAVMLGMVWWALCGIVKYLFTKIG
jgi:hypothetical protein